MNQDLSQLNSFQVSTIGNNSPTNEKENFFINSSKKPFEKSEKVKHEDNS